NTPKEIAISTRFIKIPVHTNGWELDGNRTNISMEKSSPNLGERKGADYSLSQELHDNPQAAPARIASESSQSRHQFQGPLEENRAEIFTGDYSPAQAEHYTENSSNFNSGIDKSPVVVPVNTSQLNVNVPYRTDKDKSKVWVLKDDTSIVRKVQEDRLKSQNIVVPKYNSPLERIDQLPVNPSNTLLFKPMLIDLGPSNNELDYNMFWTKQRMSITGQVMRIQAWTPNFKPVEETPLVLKWISLPELSWHCYNKTFVTGLLSPIGKVLYLDFASIRKIRGSQARVKVQVDLTQERLPHVWMGYIGEDITGWWQKIEYDNIAKYFFYCKHQGNLESNCTIKQRDEDNKKRKEVEKVRKKNKKVIDTAEHPPGHKDAGQREDTTTNRHKQQRD
ncbi:hypothetical protein H5410_046163, partial [Solanum commersonii]